MTVPTAGEATLNVSEKNGVLVMSSMDIVAFINSTRTKHDPALEHADFLKKVREEIDNAGNFSDVYIGGNGQERPCYYLDEEASTLMVMSYSKVVRKTIFSPKREVVQLQPPQQATIADTIQTLRLTVNDDGTTTMTSLELVDFINSIRGPDEALLRHDHFMVKVPTVLKNDAPKFLGTQNYGNGNTRSVYVFPRKPALRMALSYSTGLQEAVLDAWDDLTPPLPTHCAIAT